MLLEFESEAEEKFESPEKVLRLHRVFDKIQLSLTRPRPFFFWFVQVVLWEPMRKGKTGQAGERNKEQQRSPGEVFLDVECLSFEKTKEALSRRKKRLQRLHRDMVTCEVQVRVSQTVEDLYEPMRSMCKTGLVLVGFGGISLSYCMLIVWAH